MAKTIQPRTWKTALYDPDKNYNIQKPIQKPKTEDNKSLYYSLLDDLNELYKLLCKLNYITQERNIKQSFTEKKKE
jgi:hypothetical protein